MHVDRAWGAGFLAVIAIAGGFIVAHARSPDAPSGSDLSVAPGARVVASAAGGSAIDTASDHNQYRYMAIAGPAGMTGARLLGAERQQFIHAGWRCARTRLVHLKPRGETYRLFPRPCPARQSTSTATLVSPAKRVRLYLDVVTVTGDFDAAQQFDGTPLEGNGAILQAQRHHEPVVSVMIANGF